MPTFYPGQPDFIEALNALATVAGAGIRYDAAQSLTDPQKAQARANIGFDAAVRAVALAGLSLATSTAVSDTDTVLVALGKLQAQTTLRAPLASPALTGTPTAPTAAGGTNTTQIATTAYVRAEIAALVNSAPGALDTLNELAAALGDDPNFAATMTTALAGKAALAGAVFTGTVEALEFIGPLDVSNLTGDTLPAAIVNASLNSIVPDGGLLGVAGDIALAWDKEIRFAYDADYFHTINSAAPERELQFLNASNDTRADFVWMNTKTGIGDITERMRLSTSRLSLQARQTIVVDADSFALEVDNASTSGYGVRIRSAGVGGEPALAIENAAGSATVARILNNGAIIAVAGNFEYGVFLANGTGVLEIGDSGGTARRALLRAGDQFVLGDVDNSTSGSYMSICTNFSQRHVIDNNQIGVWTATGLEVTGSVGATVSTGVAGSFSSTADGRINVFGAAGYGMVFVQASSGNSAQVQLNAVGAKRWSHGSNPDGSYTLTNETDAVTPLMVTSANRIVVVLPTSASGLPPGALWNDSGTVKVA